MNILFCNKFFYVKGGAEVSLFNTANILGRHGHKALFMSMKDPKNLPSEFSKYFVSNVDYDSGHIYNRVKAAGRIFYSIEARRKVRGLLREHKVDIAHLNNIAHQLSPSILYEFKKENIPMVMSLRDYKLVCPSYNLIASGRPCEECRNGHFFSAIKKRCHKGSLSSSALLSLEMFLHHHILHVYDLIDIFIATSKFLKNKMQEMGFKGRIVHLPNFVDLTCYPEPRYSKDERVAVYFGRLSVEKGLLTLCKAFKRLDITLYIIGNGPQKHDLKDFVERESIANIRFIDHMTNEKLIEMISRVMFVVLPSEWYEPFGRTALEAFALGKPVLGSRIGGIPEIVREGETGLLFEPGNADDLRCNAEKLIMNEKSRIDMGKRARMFVEKELNADVHYEKLMSIYNNVMKKNSC